MNKLSRVAVLVAGILPTSLLAQTLQGQLVNTENQAIAGAKVVVEGTSNSTMTDENGRFILNDLTVGNNQLHITANGYAHLDTGVTVSNAPTTQVNFTLQRSPIEVIDIVASPMHTSVMESATPVNVLSGETLRNQQAATLGDSLEKLAGVHSSFHANVASTPVIRGLSGSRVLIAQNGLDVSDVSRVGPDHAVASEASTSQQIEVLRGPATLLYGSGAAGGVVNVVDGRVPTDTSTRGEWNLQGDSVNDQKQASVNLTTGTDNIGFYVDAFWRDANDYQVPGNPELEHDDDHDHDHDDHDDHEHDEHGGDYEVENSAEESSGFTLGTSYLFDQGYVGVAVEQFDREYGIPGHSHGGDELVYADLEQTRVQLLGEMNFSDSFISSANLRAGYTDYEHTEIEEGMVGTVFANETSELRLDFAHKPIVHWQGVFSFHYKNTDIEAQGEEAFTPPSTTETFGVSLLEERHFGDVLVQLGARVERVTIDAPNVLLPELDAHVHDDDHEDHEDEHDHGDEDDHGEVIRVFDVQHEFTPISLSAGLVWDFAEGYNLGVAISRSERAPSASELLSFGPHIGTRSYEIGALFAIHDEDGESHIDLTDAKLDLETANNIDISLRKKYGNVGFVLNAFYNQIDDYYYQENTGLFGESGHDHDDEEHGHDDNSDEAHDEHSDELPVYIFKTGDVTLSGFEAQVAWQVNDTFKATFISDYVRAKLDDGGNLPRTPPLRFGTQFLYQNESLTATLDITRYQKQDKIAEFETQTDGYTLVDASITYDLSIADQDLALYLKASNLTDEEARVHTSFLKDIAPRPGRNIAVGIRGYF